MVMTSVDWTLVNTTSANPSSSSSSYADSNYNDGATWIIGGYQGSGKSPGTIGFSQMLLLVVYIMIPLTLVVQMKIENHGICLNKKTAPYNGYFTMTVYQKTGLDHYAGGYTNDPQSSD